MLVKDYFRLKKTDGDVGIEVEVEGYDLPPAPKGWRREHDGSLKGADNGEYVLNAPVNVDKLQDTVYALRDQFKKYNSRIDKTYRAGIHVHVNVQDLTMVQLANFMTIYYLYENALVSLCEKCRVGNHFNLRATDADWQVDNIRNALIDGDLNRIRTDDARYSAMNLQSLFRYGSVEFRSMESYGDFDKLLFWSNLHLRIKEAAKQYPHPRAIMDVLEDGGIMSFSQQVFGKLFNELYKRAENFIGDVQACKDVAEDIAYCRIWGRKSLDIFDRNQNVF